MRHALGLLAILALAGAGAGRSAGDCGCVYFDPNRQHSALPADDGERIDDIDPLGDGERQLIEILRTRSGRPALLRFPGASGKPIYASPDRLLVTFDSVESRWEVLRSCPGEEQEELSRCLEAEDGTPIRVEKRHLGGKSFLLSLKLEEPEPDMPRGERRLEPPALAAFRALKELRTPPQERSSGQPIRSLSLDTIHFLPGQTLDAARDGGEVDGASGSEGGGEADGGPEGVGGSPAAAMPPCQLGSVRWPMSRTGTDQVWDGCGGQPPRREGSGVTIAVVDSGVDPVRHLDDRLDAFFDARFPPVLPPGVPEGRACDLPPEADDEWGHGTAIAVLAAANRRSLYPGVAPDARVLALRAFDRSGCGCSASLVSAIHCAAEREAEVITAAWAFEGGVLPLRDAIEAAASSLIVAAAGNASRDLVDQPLYPASWRPGLDNLLVAGGADRCDRWRFAGGSDIVDLVGPAIRVKVWSLAGSGEWILADGTSWAVGIVGGAAALYLQQNPGSAPSQSRTDLAASARLTGSYDPCCTGCGVLDVQAAVCGPTTAVAASDPRGCPVPGSP